MQYIATHPCGWDFANVGRRMVVVRRCRYVRTRAGIVRGRGSRPTATRLITASSQRRGLVKLLDDGRFLPFHPHHFEAYYRDQIVPDHRVLTNVSVSMSARRLRREMFSCPRLVPLLVFGRCGIRGNIVSSSSSAQMLPAQLTRHLGRNRAQRHCGTTGASCGTTIVSIGSREVIHGGFVERVGRIVDRNGACDLAVI